MIHVIVPEADMMGHSQHAAIHNAGVVQLIADDSVPFA
jgi:hypothetical protein